MQLTTKPVNVDSVAGDFHPLAGVGEIASPKSSPSVCSYCGGAGSVQVKDQATGGMKMAACSACGNRGIVAK